MSLVTDKTYDLSEKKKFKDVVTLSTDETTFAVEFKNDIKGQVVYSEKGNNIVVTAYATKEVSYNKVETVVSSEKILSGKYKGKYECITTTYKATYDEDGNMTGYEEGTSKTTYVKKAGNDITETVYNQLNAKGKVIATLTEAEMAEANKTVVDTSNVLGTITYKNADLYGSDLRVYTASLDGDFYDLLNDSYAPIKSKNKYTGTWLTEEVSSTSANETFALGVNKEGLDADVIKYDMSTKQGKDTVKLVSGSHINLEFENDDGLTQTFKKSGNNVVVTFSKAGGYTGPEYTKYETIVTKSGSGYDALFLAYEWDETLNGGAGDWVCVSDPDAEPYHYTAAEFNEVKESMAGEGINLGVGTTVYYVDNEGHAYSGDAVAFAEITLKDYLKLGEDSVTINDISLKSILNGDVLYQSGKAKKANKISDTAYNDYIVGGNKADKITISGVGNDIVIGGAGNDTITITKDASGVKDLEFDKGSGKDTVIIEGNTGALLYNHAVDEGHEGVISYEKTGNDLIMKTFYEKDPTNKKSKNVTDTVTVKDYFDGKEDKILFAQYDGEEYSGVGLEGAIGEDNYLTVNGVKNNDKKSDFYKELVFEGSDLNDSMTYSGKGAANMFGGAGNDEYNVNLNKKTDLFIYDDEVSGEDGVNTVNLSVDSSNFRVFFNADKDGIVTSQGVFETDFLEVFSADAVNYKNIKNIVKGKGTGYVEIGDYFATVSNGDISEVNKSNLFVFNTTEASGDLSALVPISMNDYIDCIEGSVVAWFEAHSDYSDMTAMDVFVTADKATVESLLAAYNVAYDEELIAH